MRYPDEYYDLPARHQARFKKAVDDDLANCRLYQALKRAIDVMPDYEDVIDAAMERLHKRSVDRVWALSGELELFSDEDDETRFMTKNNAVAV